MSKHCPGRSSLPSRLFISHFRRVSTPRVSTFEGVPSPSPRAFTHHHLHLLMSVSSSLYSMESPCHTPSPPFALSTPQPLLITSSCLILFWHPNTSRSSSIVTLICFTLRNTLQRSDSFTHSQGLVHSHLALAVTAAPLLSSYRVTGSSSQPFDELRFRPCNAKQQGLYMLMIEAAQAHRRGRKRRGEKMSCLWPVGLPSAVGERPY